MTIYYQQSRGDWLRNFLVPRLRWRPAREQRERKKEARWLVRLEARHVTVSAHTRSEASGLAKRHFKLDRLPPKTKIVRLVQSTT